MASESTPPPPSGGGARYAIGGVALAVVALLGYCMIAPGTPPPTVAHVGPVDSGVPQRSTALVDDDLVIPEDEPDAGAVDAAEPVAEPTHRPSGQRPPGAGEWDSCSGELDARPVFEEFRPEFQACYEHRLKANPMLQGQMMLQVRVTADGRVDGVQVGGSLRDREVFTCVRNLANRMHFPHVTGGTCAVVAVPYTFTPRQ